jgi:hypothetical protein
MYLRAKEGLSRKSFVVRTPEESVREEVSWASQSQRRQSRR